MKTSGTTSRLAATGQSLTVSPGGSNGPTHVALTAVDGKKVALVLLTPAEARAHAVLLLFHADHAEGVEWSPSMVRDAKEHFLSSAPRHAAAASKPEDEDEGLAFGSVHDAPTVVHHDDGAVTVSRPVGGVIGTGGKDGPTGGLLTAKDPVPGISGMGGGGTATSMGVHGLGGVGR